MIEINGKITKRIVKPAPLLSLLPDSGIQSVTVTAEDRNYRPITLSATAPVPTVTLHPGESIKIYSPELYTVASERTADVMLEYTREVEE